LLDVAVAAGCEQCSKDFAMVLIQFPDRETEIKALAFLVGRFSGKVMRGSVHIVPEAALEALASESSPFSVNGKATYEHQMAELRDAGAPAVQ
jgi:hypothetical protein